MNYSSEIADFIGKKSAFTRFFDQESFDEIFVIRMRDFVGNPYEYTVKNFADAACNISENQLDIAFTDCEELSGTKVDVRILRQADTSLEWNITVTPGRDFFKVEWIDFPRVKLIKDKNCKFLIPNAEGTLISDLESREELATFKCALAEYPLTGIDSFYPGPAAAQFEAVYDDDCGLYIGCHDKTDSPKVLDFMPQSGRARTVLQQFTQGENSPFGSVVMQSFCGNWQDAAEIYRCWMESSSKLPEKMTDNVPPLLDMSPIIIAYPVKGFGIDAGGLVPNEYYPYMNGLSVMERYNKLWNNSVMALLMHWEGTAPWAPPFIWPPSGGEAMLKEYVDAMHAKGNSVGLYSSGIAWTQKSMIDPDYSLEERFVSDHVENEICIGPRGEAWSRVCNSPRGQRIGYDLCPQREYTANVVCNEVAGAAGIGVDYLQYFDQNQGCTSPLCYSKKHGHPELPGPWQTQAMQSLLDKAQETAGKTLIGCENAAAQPYIKVCKLNDLRNHLAWGTGGIPVALYSYLYHEYTSGFSGNGVWLHGQIDQEKTPDFTLWNLAWNFVSGNVLSVILKDKGELHWNWCRLWKDPAPEQEPLIKLIGNLSKWRREEMKKFLVAGRMVKAPEVISPVCTIYTKNQIPPQVPTVLSAAWQNGDKTALILASSMKEDTEVEVKLPQTAEVKIISAKEEYVIQAKDFKVNAPALDAVLVIY